jgi:2'-5' RNA ligase
VDEDERMGDRLRLFVGLGVGGLEEPLLEVSPDVGPGTRVEPYERLHLTLHFLGRLRVDDVDVALGQVRFPPFVLALDGLGVFEARSRTVLWVGVRPVPELLDLHRDVGQVLRGIGYEPDPRPWRPHITLARSTREGARQFRTRAAPVGATTVTELVLFSSHLEGDEPAYVRERTYRAG